MAMVTRTKAQIRGSRELASSKTLARYNSAEKRLPDAGYTVSGLSRRVDRGYKPRFRPGESRRQPGRRVSEESRQQPRHRPDHGHVSRHAPTIGGKTTLGEGNDDYRCLGGDSRAGGF